MKTLVIFLILLSPVLAVSQISNADFENWSILNGVEEPDNWNTNNHPNSISVTKTSDSYSANYAMQLINNGMSLEGPLPGYAMTFFTTNDFVNQISAYVKCDSLTGKAAKVLS
jgi:hypothetical protein